MGIYSRDEIERILNQYGDTIYRMAFIQVKSRDTADDIYQEVCMKLIRQKSCIEPEEHLKAWLLRTTINCCKDYWKSAWLQKICLKNNGDQSDEQGDFAGEPIDAAREWDTYAEMEKEESPGYVTECVQRLPEKYRTVIHLYYYEGYSQAEIASLLGTNENTVASRIARGRKQLKKMLKEDEVKAYGY